MQATARRFDIGWVQFWAGIALSGLCLWLALKEVDLSQVGRVLSQARWGFVLAALALVVTAPLLRAFRWRLLLSLHPHRPRIRRLFVILVIGQMVNTVLPARLGELARAHLMGELESESRAFVLGTIASEKLTDMIMLLLAFLAVIPLVPLPPWLQNVAAGMSITTVAVFLMAVVSARLLERWLAVLNHLLALLPDMVHLWVIRHIKLAFQGLGGLSRWDISLPVLGWSAVLWAFGALINYFSLLALGIHMPFSVSVFILVVLQAGVAVPSALGKVGVFQYLCVLALSIFSVERGLAFSYGLLLSLIVLLPPTILGVLFLAWESARLRHSKQVPREAGAGPGGLS